MAIYLGNQTISDLERRTDYVFSSEDRKWLESHRQDEADIKFDSDKFHIFDLPFEIHAAESISDYLLNLLMKYEKVTPSKEQLQFAAVKETEKQKEKRLKKEKENKEWQDKLKNPDSIWNVKWHMLVPVIVNNKEYYYWCFINTYTTGRENIPDIIEGKATIRGDEEGFHGNFTLYNPETDNDANEYDDWNDVIGCGYVAKSGSRIGRLENLCFDNVEFSIKECIQNYLNFNNCAKEFHFNKIKKEN